MKLAIVILFQVNMTRLLKGRIVRQRIMNKKYGFGNIDHKPRIQLGRSVRPGSSQRRIPRDLPGEVHETLGLVMSDRPSLVAVIKLARD